MELTELTRKLISIPSYVNENTNERQIGEFIAGYLRSLKWLTVETPPVEGGRFNVIAHDGFPPRLMFCCHMDTVPHLEIGYMILSMGILKVENCLALVLVI